MAKLIWDATGERTYETGVDHGVLYPQVNGAYPKGVAWNGLTAVTETPSGAEANAIYADNIKYLNLFSAEDFGATVEAYTYPEEFEKCDGSADAGVKGLSIGQQKRQSFGLSYRTIIGNDSEGDSHGYKLHLIYAAMASPSEKNYQTVNDSPEAISFSWEVTTTPVAFTKRFKVGDDPIELKPTARLTIDSTKVDSTRLATLEAKLYGTDKDEAQLPSPDEVLTILGATEVQ